MYRLKPIRRRKTPRPPRALIDAANVAFCVLLLFAVGLGGAQAVTGLPALFTTILPPGVVAANASTSPQDSIISLLVDPPPPPSRFAPQVLYPITGHPFPSWLTAPAPEPAAAAVAHPMIAIVIDDLGADLARTDRAIRLPRPVTLSFLPFAEATPFLSAEAVRDGHAVLVHMPMEAEGDRETGPFALATTLKPDDIRARLVAALARVPGAVGINNHRGSRFTADGNALIPVAEELAQRHLFFFDSRTTAQTQVVPVARAFGVASAGRDVFLDDEQTATAVGGQLMELERRARAAGVAIAIGHPHDVTLEALQAWTARAAARGFTLIPLEEAIRLKTGREVRTALAATR